ncbi:unnamed protein product [Mytilus edulis]|uniref:Uncharacterized protein n=1 Tax=Mytilus edulis TaxID=6550 RepID=A0A8S3U414_MYTED|nr:unnamed protein product [Mytilus edulis]
MGKQLDIQLPCLVDADEFRRMLSKGEFISYEHRLSLGGPCMVGKSTLASVLIGTEIPQRWTSTNGLVIYFGRNGIDIEKKKMVPLNEGERIHDIVAKILRVQPDVLQKSKQITGQKTTTPAFMTSTEVETCKVASKSSTKDLQLITKTTKYSEELAIQTCTSITEHASEQMLDGTKYSAIDEKQLLECKKLQDILEEVRNGKYRIEIAPSDLIDFGGQKSYDMTHQLFIQHSGSFLLMFDGRFGLNNQLEGYEDGVTATC